MNKKIVAMLCLVTVLFTAVAVSSMMFAFLHASNSGVSILAFINLALFGVFASLYMLRMGNIWGVCAIHSVWNFTQGNFYGCLVSGINTNNSILSTDINIDRAVTNGGMFGPEGGVVATIVLLVAIMLVVYIPERKKLK